MADNDLPVPSADAQSANEPAETHLDSPLDAMPRRDFLRMTGMGAAAAMVTAGCATTSSKMSPASGIVSGGVRGDGPGHIVVIGAGAWGSWTSYHLRKRGARVTLIDQYGPANSRATSGDETRGIRSSYGDRTTGEQWSMWARTAIKRWQEFDAEWAKPFGTKFYHETGDVIMRAADEPFIKRTREIWTAQGTKHEVIDGAEVRKRWPVIGADDITIAIVEPDAGVARARASTQAVAAISQKMGAKFILSRVRLGEIRNGQMDGVVLENGTIVRGDAYVFACGPWLRKLFPTLMENRMRIPLGYVCYFGTPIGDDRFTYPNLPSYNFPGVTGWAALPVDSRGFRVRGGIAAPGATQPQVPGGPGSAATPPAGNAAAANGGRAGGGGATTAGGAANAGGGRQGGGGGGGGGGNNQPLDPAQNDPDLSTRWASEDRIIGSRRFVQLRFPLLANAPLLETRSCHYESSINRDFIIDKLPNASNAWIAGVGQAEGFKFGPVVGEYVAMRVLGHEGDPKLVTAFKLPKEEYDR